MQWLQRGFCCAQAHVLLKTLVHEGGLNCNKYAALNFAAFAAAEAGRFKDASTKVGPRTHVWALPRQQLTPCLARRLLSQPASALRGVEDWGSRLNANKTIRVSKECEVLFFVDCVCLATNEAAGKAGCRTVPRLLCMIRGGACMSSSAEARDA